MPVDDKDDFTKVATRWERKWSALCGGSFTPVVAVTPFLNRLGMTTVVAHRGSVGCEMLAAIGKPVVNEKTKYVSEYLFVMDRTHTILPAGMTGFGLPQISYDVLVTVDGTVTQFLNVKDRQALEDANWVIDLVIAPLLAPVMIEMAVGRSGLGTALTTRSGSRATRTVLAGPTRELVDIVLIDTTYRPAIVNTVREVGLERAMTSRGFKFAGYERRMGIPSRHFDAMVAAAKETETIVVMRANKELHIKLIENGAVGKAKELSIPRFKSSSKTGVLTATEPEQFALVKAKGYATLELHGGKPMMRLGNELKPLPRTPYWTVGEGQVMTAEGHVVVGDYDGLGALPVKSPGRNLGLVPDDVFKGDWMGGDWQRVMKAVNRRLDRPQVLHGAQDGFPDIQ